MKSKHRAVGICLHVASQRLNSNSITYALSKSHKQVQEGMCLSFKEAGDSEISIDEFRISDPKLNNHINKILVGKGIL